MPPSKPGPAPKKKRSPVQHVRPFWDELSEAGWILTFPVEEKPPALRTVPVYGKRPIDSPVGGVRFIGIDDEYRPNPRSCCPACLADDQCPAWTVDPEGYERRKPHERVRLSVEQKAARTLGVEWPCTEEQLTIGFRDATAKAHPDHGGSDEQMKRVIEAREMLETAGRTR